MDKLNTNDHLLKNAVTVSTDFENFKDNFLFPFVFLPIDRPNFNKFLEVHFKVYSMLYKNIYTVQEYAKTALHEELNEFEIYGMQLKEVVEKNKSYFNKKVKIMKNNKKIKEDLCYDSSHMKMECRDNVVRCLSCNLTKISAEHQVEDINKALIYEKDTPEYMIEKTNENIMFSIKKLAKKILKNDKSIYDFKNIYIGKSKDKLAINVAYKHKKDCFKTIEIRYYD